MLNNLRVWNACMLALERELRMAQYRQSEGTKTAMDVRRGVLEQVEARQESNEGGSRMKGKVGIITGVGPDIGIGTATARLMAREGAAHIYLLDYVDSHFVGLIKVLQKSFPRTRITAVKGDVSDPKAISDLVDRALREEQHLDFFFANAGIIGERLPTDENGKPIIRTAASQMLARISDIREDDFMHVMKINALGPFIAAKYAGPAMAKVCPAKGKTVPGGSIVFTASVAGLRANGGPIAYSASKAAVANMATTCSVEFTGQNVRVNAICPGLIKTDMTKPQFDLADSHGKADLMGILSPSLRQGLGSDVAQVALFLTSDESSYINGQSIAVDGGLSACLPFIPRRRNAQSKL